METDALIVPWSLVKTVSMGSVAADLYGSKARGLLELPKGWVPPFFILSIPLCSRLAAYCRQSEPEFAPIDDLCSRALSPDEVAKITGALNELASLPANSLLVRSSAREEDLSLRGHYDSKVCDTEMKSMLATAIEVLARHIEPNPEMAVIVQVNVHTPAARGHLSNERRISRRKNTWRFEQETLEPTNQPDSETFQVAPSAHLEEAADLPCVTPNELKQALHRVAIWANNRGKRWHFEWVWDRTQLWVVQADAAPGRKGGGPRCSRYHESGSLDPGSLECIEPEIRVPKGLWKKTDCAKVFREARDFPVSLWILQDSRVLQSLAEGSTEPSVFRDLERITGAPTVVRTELRPKDGLEILNLPHSGLLRSAEEAVQWLIQTAKTLAGSGQEYCFILHHFIPAMASAWCLASPKSTRARIDSLWGLADGLQYYPHDSFDASIDKTGDISRRIRYKEEFIDLDAEGRWAPSLTGAPWDWNASLSDEHVREIAQGSGRIARQLGKDVLVMWFIRGSREAPERACIPWFYVTEELPLEYEKASVRRAIPREFIIRSLQDISRVRQALSRRPGVNRVKVKAEPSQIRSREFVEGVVTLAQEHKLSVELEGSILAHAFYQLRRAGIPVLPSDPFEPEHEVIEFNKLVRDRIPERISGRGERVAISRLKGEELILFLKAKVIEEALELYSSSTTDDALQEIVDVFEVLRSLRESLCVSEAAIRDRMKRKREERGGFAEGIVLRTTQERSPVEPLAEYAELVASDDDTSSPIQEIGTGLYPLSILEYPSQRGLKLTLPLVPPPRRPGQENRTFTFVTKTGRIRVTYDVHDIVIETLPLEEDHGDESHQLEFGFVP